VSFSPNFLLQIDVHFLGAIFYRNWYLRPIAKPSGYGTILLGVLTIATQVPSSILDISSGLQGKTEIAVLMMLIAFSPCRVGPGYDIDSPFKDLEKGANDG